MNYNIDPERLRQVAAQMGAEISARNTPEAFAKRAADERARKIARGISYRRRCDARDAMVLGAKVR